MDFFHCQRFSRTLTDTIDMVVKMVSGMMIYGMYYPEMASPPPTLSSAATKTALRCQYARNPK